MEAINSSSRGLRLHDLNQEGKDFSKICSIAKQPRSLGGEDPLEEDMVTHSSILTWRIPWTEEPGR